MQLISSILVACRGVPAEWQNKKDTYVGKVEIFTSRNWQSTKSLFNVFIMRGGRNNLKKTLLKIVCYFLTLFLLSAIIFVVTLWIFSLIDAPSSQNNWIT